MCGICGFVTKKHISLEVLNKMNDTMLHRGPDIMVLIYGFVAFGTLAHVFL